MSSTEKSQNIKAAIKVTVKTSGSYAAAAKAQAKNLSSRSEAKQASELKKILILPPFVREMNLRDRNGRYKIWVVDGNLEKQKKIRPEFNDVSDLLSYLQKYHTDIDFIICPYSLKKGFQTLIPTLPGTLFNHLKKHHKDVLKKLGLDPKSYSPVIWSHQMKDYSTPTLERKRRSNLFRKKSKGHAKGKSKVKITKKDIENWPELGADDSKIKAKAKAKANTKRKSHQRKKNLDLRDKDGNELDSISSSNAFSSLASDTD